MSVRSKVLLIISLICIVAGGIVLAFAISKGVPQYEYSEEKIEINEDFSSLKVDLEITDLEIKPSDDGKNKVVFYESEKISHEAKVEDDILLVKSEDKRDWYDKFGYINRNRVTIYLNKTEYTDLTIINHTGDVLIRKTINYNNVDINSSTGDVEFYTNVTNLLKIKVSTGNILIKESEAKNCNLTATTGDITLKSLNVTETVTIEGSTSDIIVDGLNCKNYTTSNGTGKNKLKDLIVSENMNITATTGDVLFDRCNGFEITVKCSTGDVKGTLLSPKAFNVNTSTGKQKTPPSVYDNGGCTITTSTGDIIIEIAN